MATRNTIQSVERSFEVIEAVIELDGAGVTQLAEHMGISVSGMHKQLSTLRDLGYLRKRDGEYDVSYELYGLGEEIRRRDPLYEVSRTPLDRLARITYTRANLYAREDGRAVCLYSTAGGQEVSTDAEEGRIIALDEGVAGRVMLACDADESVNRSGVAGLESGLTVVGDHRVGVETAEGHRRIAIAVTGADRTPGAVEVLAPTDQIEGRLVDEDILSMVVSTAEAIEERR